MRPARRGFAARRAEVPDSKASESATPRIAWWVRLALAMAGAALLLGNLDLFAYIGHTLPLANHLGLDGVLAQIAAPTPALRTLAIDGCIACRLRCRAQVFRMD
jgi:hypothetical protein